ncbi:hypothetical protein Pla123a_35990 [Posidoniimonas polymericola]|uniref:Lipoprotein n=1 Tax=Posidoniimonas polymericola TaxID=2528002 RepID=A0A5C5YDB7_9BACT|nr:hypothetical protein [Posidoniimonas polymericola]TWT73706.1 hypothetical protein Pla123a_35990 [Posidoniimonas polymericola]
MPTRLPAFQIPAARATAAQSLGACLLALGLGCTPVEPAAQIDVDAARQELVLTEEPADPQTALDLSEREGGFDEGDVVLVGQVGGMPNPWGDAESEFPWRAGEASFFIVDPSTVAEFSGHEHDATEDHSDCVFCQKRAADSVHSVAAVTFNGPDGKPLPVDARKLFQIDADDIVVVKGFAKRIGGDLLVVDAKGLYVRR